MTTLYNQQGRAIAYISDDNGSVYLYNGKPVGWLSDDNVYAYNGRYLGWIYNDWFYDRNGRPKFFTENSTGGPARPARAARPARSARAARPARSARESRPAIPVRSLTWSILPDEGYFSQ